MIFAKAQINGGHLDFVVIGKAEDCAKNSFMLITETCLFDKRHEGQFHVCVKASWLLPQYKEFVDLLEEGSDFICYDKETAAMFANLLPFKSIHCYEDIFRCKPTQPVLNLGGLVRWIREVRRVMLTPQGFHALLGYQGKFGFLKKL